MMFFSSSYLGIKRNQDYADFSTIDDLQGLMLCDGIGEFEKSGELAKNVVECFFSNQYSSISEIIDDKQLINFRKSGIKAGTTILLAKKLLETNDVIIQYLGNGGIVYLAGDFARNPNTNVPYRFIELMLPHVSPKGELIKHFSHNSGPLELDYSEMRLSLNNPCGDILLFFTDGISALEEKYIIADDLNRYWRSESSALQFILKELNDFLQQTSKVDFQDGLSKFNMEVLWKLNENKILEDDSSLGIIITDAVLDFYQLKND